MELAGKNILVVGLGRTGLATARFLHNRGACVTVSDIGPEARLVPQVEALRAIGVRLEIGPHRTETFLRADLIVVSPGVPHTIGPLLQAREKRIDVLGEIELAARFVKEPIIAVTGTNGKTTTTTLLGEIFKAAGRRAFVGGNIGNPLIEYVARQEKADCVIVEISSFQLDTIADFRPTVAVLLNVTPDHLDRYPDFAGYVASKGRIFMNQDETDIAVLNGADPVVRSLSRQIRARKMFFASEPVQNADRAAEAVIRPDALTIGYGPGRVETIALGGIQLLGRHNLENMAAAGLVAASQGIPPAQIEAALKAFKGLPHRLETITTNRGVRYVNDSKSTNFDSVVRALEAFVAPVILILGGRHKGGDFAELQDIVQRHVKHLIALGESRELIQAVFAETVPTTPAATMAEAIAAARSTATAGDTVLLSPGCASFDLYTNYVQRGDDFRRLAVQP